MLKVLYLGYVWPEPNSSAAGGRTLEILHSFRAQGWQVLYASAASLSPHRFPLESIGIAEQLIAINDDGFDELLREYCPEIVVFDRFFTEEQFAWRVEKNCPAALRVLDTCDLHSLREARQVLLKEQLQKQGNWQAPNLQQIAQTMRHSELAIREIAAIFRCDLSLMISDVEMELLQSVFSVPSSILLLNRLMLLPRTSDTRPSYDERHDFVTIGNFRHAPNWDAVLWLKQAVWPALRKRMPSAQLKVYGAYPPPKAMQLHQPRDGFYVLGWAENAQDVMANARVCLAPLRFGAGIKGKLADAMLAGTPSVTTSVGAEAMDVGGVWPGAVSDDIEVFAQASVDLYQNRERWSQAQEMGDKIVALLFDRERDQIDLINRIVHARENVEQVRSHNFMGTMLRHHSMKSTQYMSQWIALKNQLPVAE
ncbi:glycosyltransferase family 4 protein [Undibacterium sp. LX40W]|uniref:Glycosyltransferase family 4 protein n=1 Tax=Undibacterium nitidum TaxID=2762298 RepID=A0A923KT11_9BURK|nr:MULTISPECIES: glycosyltransferase [Undibacterium]MBC3881791.1 glycosyltransferase family 4 protein [Undibacterium nitidum]MBC3892212.1 glycosyltransferase family 4 protein [Undibacterium sp. LX40W]